MIRLIITALGDALSVYFNPAIRFRQDIDADSSTFGDEARGDGHVDYDVGS